MKHRSNDGHAKVSLGEGVRVVPCPVAPGGFARSPVAWSGRQKKRVYNEMVEFWGSVAELVHHKVTGGLPQPSLKENEAITFLRSILLFQID